ncbi:glycosyltransferase family A protein [Hyphomicrobium sp. CS1GBMeth3]|uniref:glycosyltransferase family A protein n=1 Tax=Hyphomicrobium sp. CS1GBMeth3 TaxID=1892845 RepID=UPI000930F415|nr:glycosyltransferase family A protein [Hyphomicrobium sp. CS1GBMeth3]
MATAQNDSVCVCIAAYNAERTIARAVASALAQAHVTEVIVVDDASTDATAAAAEQSDDGTGRLSVAVLERNSGPSVARNAALARSRAALFCVLDSDDYFLPDRIRRLLAADYGAWDFLADDILIVPESLAETRAREMSDEAQRAPLTLDLPTFVRSNISHPRRPRAELGFLKPLMRRRFLDGRNLRYEPGLRLGEDYALYVNALMAGAKFKVAGFSGYVAVERSSSLSAVHKAADLAAICAFDTASAETPGLYEPARQALAAHEQATAGKWALARALEIRREQGVGAALRFLSRQPASIPYVASEIARAKSARLGRRLWGQDNGDAGQPAIRRLIGEKTIGVV